MTQRRVWMIGSAAMLIAAALIWLASGSYLVAAIFGAGGLVALVKTALNWKKFDAYRKG